MKQYLDLCRRILDEGHMIPNERTGKGCLTVINHDMTYDVGMGEFPLVTTRKAYWKAAIAELLGYIRGYTDAMQFKELGAPTWLDNAAAPIWQQNPYCKHPTDMGRVYGAQGRAWPMTDKPNNPLDQLFKIYTHLKEGKDDRGEILTFWNPGEFHMGCLRPCMFMYQFSLLDGRLYLNAYQRSIDVPLGLVFNMPQVYVFLALMAQITGHQPGQAYHKLINCHLYEDQIDLMKEQVTREPFPAPRLEINPDIKSLTDLETWVTTDDFTLIGYEHHEPIAYPFSV